LPELLGKVVGAELELERAVASAVDQRMDGSDLATRLATLASLRQALSTAAPADIPTLRGEISATVAASLAAVQQLQNGPSNSASAAEAQRGQAVAAVQHAVSDYFDRRVLDPYLHFTSAEDEEAFRRRERARQEAIERELAKGTVDGQRNAARIMQDQILDAGAFGADHSPEYSGMLDNVTNARADLDKLAGPQPQGSTKASADTSKPKGNELDDAMAAFRAAGIETSSTDLEGHGLRDRIKGNEVTVGLG
jgi:hypothetical protein